jgi:hypothetical protein
MAGSSPAITNCNAGSAAVHLNAIKIFRASLATDQQGDVMERRHFLKIAAGVAAGAAALAASAQAAPLLPHPLAKDELPPGNQDARPAVTTGSEVDSLKPEQVRWHRHWHHRHWGWHRHHWRHRHWGWRRRHWHRWHRRHW